MTTNHHTPVSPTDLVNAANTNAPLGELDQVITDLLAGSEAFAGLIVGGIDNAIVTEYADTNQDSDIELQGRSYAGGTIDTTASGFTAVLGDSGGSELMQAQSFIANEGHISQFVVGFGANTGSPSGDCTWEIQNDSAGDPDGTAIESGTFTITPSSNNTINIVDGVYLDGVSTYWLVLSVPAQATNVSYNVVRSNSSVYANGEHSFSTDGGSSWTPQANDLDVAVTTDTITKNDSLAQGIQVSQNVTVNSIRLWLKKTGSPTDNLTVAIETDNSGDPSGTAVTNGTSATVAASTLAGTYGWIEFTFATDPTIEADTQYHLVLDTTDTQDNADYVEWGADESAPSYANGVMKRERSAVWSSQSADASFEVYGTSIASSSALLEVVSMTQGTLPPRMTTTQRDLITPPNGTMIYNTTTNLINVYQGGAWIALSASGAGGEALVELVAPTLVTAQSSVNISGISGAYKDLLLVVYAQSNAAGTPWELRVQVNSDTGTNYRVATDNFVSSADLNTDNAANGIDVPIGDDSTEMWAYEFWFWNYADTSDYRAISFEGAKQTDDGSGQTGSFLGNGYYEDATTAISSIQLTENNSDDWDGQYALYGLG